MFRQEALPAFRVSCFADLAAEGHKLNVYPAPVIAWQYFHQFKLGFDRIVRIGEAESF